MANNRYLNTNIDKDILNDAREVLEEEGIETPEEAVLYVLDNRFIWHEDHLRILYEHGDLYRLWESPIYQEAVAACIEHVTELLEEEQKKKQ